MTIKQLFGHVGRTPTPEASEIPSESSAVPGDFLPLYGAYGTPADGQVPTWVAADSRVAWMDPSGGALADGDYGDIVVSASGTVFTIDTNAVSNAKFRQSVATSVVGRSANSTGNVADIAASADGQLLVRRSAALTWDTLIAGDIPSLDASKITTGTMATARLGSGSATSSTFLRGDQTWAVPSGASLADGDYGDIVVSVSGTVMTIDTNVVGDTKLRQGTACTVIGRSANSTGNVADIALNADGKFLVRRSNVVQGDVLVAGDVPSLDASKITTGTLPEARGGTNQSTYATGDLLYASAANTLAKRAIGTTAQVLTVSGGVPAWASISTGGGGSGVLPDWLTKHPDAYPASPTIYDDEFDGASIDTAGTRSSGAQAWTAQNVGTSTVTQANSCLVIAAQVAAGDHLRGYSQPVSGSWKRRAKCFLADTANEFGFGLAVRRSSNGKMESWHIVHGAADGIYFGRLYTWTDKDTFSATIGGDQVGSGGASQGRWGGMHVYLEIEADGTNLIYRHSGTGVEGTFLTRFTRTYATFLGAAPDEIWLCMETSNAANANRGVADWFRAF